MKDMRNQQKQTIASKVKNAITSYFSETTVHGFRYVAEGENLCEKLFWGLLISVGFVFSGFTHWSPVVLLATFFAGGVHSRTFVFARDCVTGE